MPTRSSPRGRSGNNTTAFCGSGTWQGAGASPSLCPPCPSQLALGPPGLVLPRRPGFRARLRTLNWGDRAWTPRQESGWVTIHGRSLHTERPQPGPDMVPLSATHRCPLVLRPQPGQGSVQTYFLTGIFLCTQYKDQAQPWVRAGCHPLNSQGFLPGAGSPGQLQTGPLALFFSAALKQGTLGPGKCASSPCMCGWGPEIPGAPGLRSS